MRIEGKSLIIDMEDVVVLMKDYTKGYRMFRQNNNPDCIRIAIPSYITFEGEQIKVEPTITGEVRANISPIEPPSTEPPRPPQRPVNRDEMTIRTGKTEKIAVRGLKARDQELAEDLNPTDELGGADSEQTKNTSGLERTPELDRASRAISGSDHQQPEPERAE